uniref:Guanylyl cyclase n=1 Tax=Emiliania huxleyi TaxID=2903 RepID=A0A7S3VZ52_EMIHU
MWCSGARLLRAKAEAMAEVRRTRQITKSELRTLKKRVAQLRKKGFDVWTEDELEREGWTLAPLPPAAADAATPSMAQAADWDCGLACVQMALLSLDVPPPACSLKQLRARLSSDSVWTADLVYLLASYGIQCEYLTSELSAGASSAEKAGSAFYASSLEADAARVDALFARAASEEGVSIRCCKLGANELWNALRDDDQLAIVLVDGRMLYARAGRPPDGDFEGHYVLLVGLDDTTDSFRVKDPARSDRTAVVAAKASRRAAPRHPLAARLSPLDAPQLDRTCPADHRPAQRHDSFEGPT